jgi:mRNA interferase RelE/StbE
MAYKAIFSPAAERSWRKLGATVRAQFEKVLIRRLEQPHVPAARLRGFPNLYKIKLRDSGYRLAYVVRDEQLVVFIVGVGKRDETYEELKQIGRASLPGDD